jgi:hypothetical protein
MRVASNHGITEQEYAEWRHVHQAHRLPIIGATEVRRRCDYRRKVRSCFGGSRAGDQGVRGMIESYT